MGHQVGLVGLRQARAFVDVFNSYPDTEVTALCDIDPGILETVGEETGIQQRFTDYEELMDADLDIVVLSTPIQVHGIQGLQALRTGKHVLCQYIAASGPEEAEELARAFKGAGRKYMTIETDCYERKNMVMAELARRGILGELTMGRGHYIHDCKTLGKHPDGSLTWRGELWKQSPGGVSSAVHSSLPILQIFDERVEEVYAYGPGARTLPEFSWYDRVTTAGKLPSGRTVEFVFDVFSWYPAKCGYYLQGTLGCFEFDRAAVVQEGRLSSWKNLDELEQEFGLEDVIRDRRGHQSSWERIVHEFMKAIDEDRRPPQDLSDALHMTAIGWAVDESLKTGLPVKVPTLDLD